MRTLSPKCILVLKQNVHNIFQDTNQYKHVSNIAVVHNFQTITVSFVLEEDEQWKYICRC